jgi:hypothetical protein
MSSPLGADMVCKSGNSWFGARLGGVAWYAKDEKRMRDFENMHVRSIVPTLPAGCSVN